MARVTRTGKWTAFGLMLKRAADQTGNTVDRAVARASAKLASDVKRNITSGGSFAGKPFEPLSPITIQLKGSSKPLIDTAAGRNSIQSVRRGKFKYFAGIPGDVRNPQARDSDLTIAEYMRMHEFGGLNEDGNIIPARPFFGPVIKKTRAARIKEVEEDIQELFRV